MNTGLSYHEEQDFKMMQEMDQEPPCAGGHKVDGKTPMLHDLHLDGKTCDCQRMKYIVEGCGCQGRSRELHGHPNQ